jgi:hypothetical protein
MNRQQHQKRNKGFFRRDCHGSSSREGRLGQLSKKKRVSTTIHNLRQLKHKYIPKIMLFSIPPCLRRLEARTDAAIALAE